jgi:hypothetical protein
MRKETNRAIVDRALLGPLSLQRIKATKLEFFNIILKIMTLLLCGQGKS